MLTWQPNGCNNKMKTEEKFVKDTQIRIWEFVKVLQENTKFLFEL